MVAGSRRGGVGGGLGQECPVVCSMEEVILEDRALAFGQTSQLILSKLLGNHRGFRLLLSPTSRVHTTHQPQKVGETASVWKTLVKCHCAHCILVVDKLLLQDPFQFWDPAPDGGWVSFPRTVPACFRVRW